VTLGLRSESPDAGRGMHVATWNTTPAAGPGAGAAAATTIGASASVPANGRERPIRPTATRQC